MGDFAFADNLVSHPVSSFQQVSILSPGVSSPACAINCTNVTPNTFNGWFIPDGTPIELIFALKRPGGNGPDTFLFRPHFGANTITDFDFHNDAIQLDRSIFSSVADLLSHTTDTANGAVINDTHGDTITLTKVTFAQLQAHPNDFYLV